MVTNRIDCCEVPKSSYAETLFGLYPTLLPTQALYLDLEGSGNGQEDVLSLYWPYVAGHQRFSWLIRSGSSEIGPGEFRDLVQKIGAERSKWIVVFSNGQASPGERVRIADLLGQDPFPESEWVNLHYALRRSRDMKTSIREHRHVWNTRNRSLVGYSLESLEWEFDIVRPRNLRGHNNGYRDLNGASGEMEVLATTAKVIEGSATEDEEVSLRRYCEADVRNMYQIARSCEKLLFSSREQRMRRRLYSARGRRSRLNPTLSPRL